MSVTSETRHRYARAEGEFERGGGAPRTKSGQILLYFGKFRKLWKNLESFEKNWKILVKICTSQIFGKVNIKKCFSINFVFVVFPCIIFDYIFEVILS